MAITVDWAQKIIHVNQVDMVLIQSTPSIIYQHDLNDFRETLKALEASEEGMPFEDTHTHNLPVSVGGAVLARVIEFINGYSVKYEETGTPYRVNTVGANSNISEVIDLGTGEVSVSTSNSAGLQDLNSLQAASFDGEVTVKPSSIYSGTTFPVGTRGNPVNNMTDALVIAQKRGLNKFKIVESLTLTSQDYSANYEFSGDTASGVILTIDPGANVSNCTFQNLTVQGTLDNGNIVRECSVLDIINLNGFMFQCALAGTITLGGNTQATIMQCYSGIPGDENTPIIDMGDTGQALSLSDYNGEIKITNKTGNDNISITLNAGLIILDSTVRNGTITCRGLGKLIDNSVGANVNSDDLINKSQITEITDLVKQTKESIPLKKDIATEVWKKNLEDEEDDETIGFQLFEAAENIEIKLKTPKELVDEIWNKNLDEYSGSTAGGILRKIKMIFYLVLK